MGFLCRSDTVPLTVTSPPSRDAVQPIIHRLRAATRSFTQPDKGCFEPSI